MSVHQNVDPLPGLAERMRLMGVAVCPIAGGRIEPDDGSAVVLAGLDEAAVAALPPKVATRVGDHVACVFDVAGRGVALVARCAPWPDPSCEVPRYPIEAIAAQAQIATEWCRAEAMGDQITSLSEKLGDSYEELSLIYRVAQSMQLDRPTTGFFEDACEELRRTIDVKANGVWFWSERYAQMPDVLCGKTDLTARDLRRLSEELSQRFGGEHRCEPLIVNYPTEDERLRWITPRVTRLVAVPLVRKQQVIGCVWAVNKLDGGAPTGDLFTSVEAKLIGGVANEMAVYAENATLYQDSGDLLMGLLHALTSAVDAKDAYTCGHSERVALMSRRLTEQAGYDEDFQHRVYMAGLLHDVGKIGIADAVLRKAGKLTDDEFDQIKQHPTIGEHILADIRQIEDLLPGVRHHHERYDGRGYPDRLVGDDIPLMGRIICLADSFDAMTSSRTYRPGMPLEKAMAEVQRCAGQQFDPTLAQHFVDIGIEELTRIIDGHREGDNGFETLRQRNAQAA